MPNLHPATKLSRAPEALFSPLADGEGVLLSMDAGLYFSLNKTATAIWNALETDSTLEQLAQCLSRDFKVTPEHAAAGLQALLTQMIEKKLVVQKV
jgi:hypothetical protein